MDAYALLGLPRGCRDVAAIRAAWRRTALQHHPDKCGDRDAFLAVQRALAEVMSRAQDKHGELAAFRISHFAAAKLLSLLPRSDSNAIQTLRPWDAMTIGGRQPRRK